MEKIDKLHEELKEFSNFKEPEECQKFLSIADEIILQRKRESIPILLSSFNDNRDYSWVFENLMVSMDYYPVDQYVECLLENVETLLNRSESWCITIFNRVLNDEESRILFCKKICQQPKNTMVRLLNLIERDYKYHAPILEQVRHQLEDNIN